MICSLLSLSASLMIKPQKF